MSYEERIDNQGRFTERRGFTRRWFEEQTALISLAGVDFTVPMKTCFPVMLK